MHAKIENGQIVAYPVDLRREFPNTALPADLENINNIPPGYVFVYPGKHPVAGKGPHELVEETPRWDGENWVRNWVARPLPEDETYRDSVFAEIAGQVQNALDRFARERGYDNILSLCSYSHDASYTYSVEGSKGLHLRSITWTKFGNLIQEVNSGKRPMFYSYSEIEKLLPPLTWE